MFNQLKDIVANLLKLQYRVDNNTDDIKEIRNNLYDLSQIVYEMKIKQDSVKDLVDANKNEIVNDIEKRLISFENQLLKFENKSLELENKFLQNKLNNVSKNISDGKND